VARRDRLEAIEGLSDALDPVVAVLDTDALAGLNARAVAGERPDGIAADVLGPVLPNRR
jgi:glycine betaine/choline ABC-type transport system substrate-binding protein